MRRQAFAPVGAVRRNVTTDAASSHAEKEAVPEVRRGSSPDFTLDL